MLIPTLSLARSARLGCCHHCLAPRALPPRVPRPSGGSCPRPSWRVWPHVSRLDYCLVAEPPVWSEASRSDPILTRSLSGNRLTPCGSGSSPEFYLLPTRPRRRPASYASDTLPDVTPPSGPRLISVCIQPSPWARPSVGVVERDGSRFLRPDPPPWWGRRGSSTFSTSCECSQSLTPTPYPRPLRPLFHAALVAVAPLVLEPGRLPLDQELGLSGALVPVSPLVATVTPAVPYCLPHDAPSFVYS